MKVVYGNVLNWILILAFRVDVTYCAYQVFQELKSWPEAQAYCQHIKGHLAHVYSLDTVPASWRQNQEEFWVGGLLNDQGFQWTNNKDNGDKVTLLEPLIFHRGCYRPSAIIGGQPINNITAEQCFKQCKWTGSIGLVQSYCLCEHNLRGGSRTDDTACTVRCSGEKTEMCGGFKGVSMYNINKKSVKWADSEPSDEHGHDCAYIKKQQQTEGILWYSTSCSMTLPYLCHLKNNDACGVKDSCVRTSIKPDTWKNSGKGCLLLNGSTAIVDITNMHDVDIKQLPPGDYWIGLKRNRKWEWTNGLPITKSLFHHSVIPMAGTCTALSDKGKNLGLSKQQCTEKKKFICQYQHPIKNTGTSNASIDSLDGDNIRQVDMTTAFLSLRNSPATKSSDSERTNTSNKSPSVNGSESFDLEKGDYQTNLYKSIMYLAIGVASGMALVFALCVIIYVAKRCRSRNTEFKTVRYPKGKENPVLRYASDDNNEPSNHVISEPEVHYEIPCDAQESPFRATQRILQNNYVLGRDGFPTNSWRRKKAEKDTNINKNRVPEIRHVHPCSERSYGDTSYIIHNVRAQCHPNANSRGTPVDITYTGSLDTRLRKPPVQQQQNPDVRLSETYSMVERKLSEPILNVDTSDLYACVQKAMDSQQYEDYYDNGDPNIRVTLC